MQYSNHHMHSIFSDGKAAMEEYVKEAIRQNFKILGFSEHAPVSFKNEWSLSSGDVYKYKNEFIRLQQCYKDKIKLYFSLEADYIPGITTSFKDWKTELNLDYIIGSVHLVKVPKNDALWFIDGAYTNFDQGLKDVFQMDIKKGVRQYFTQINEMLINEKPDIIGHFDKIKMNNRDRYFDTKSKWYVDLIDECIEVIKETNTIVEINTRGRYKQKTDELFPSIYALNRCKEKKIPLMLNSDAHQPHEISLDFPYAIEILKNIGIKDLMVFNGKIWEQEAIG